MSTRAARRGSAHADGWTSTARGPNGRGLCKRCMQEVPEGRVFWCGRGCIDVQLAQSSQRGFRAAVFSRDRGVCAACGTDTGLQARVLHRLRQLAGYAPHLGCLEVAPMVTGGDVRDLRRALGLPPAGPLWQADHTVPLHAGGQHDPHTNGRTLCVSCHRIATRASACRRRAT